MGRSKKNHRRFQSNRKTGLLFVRQEAYDAAIAKMPEDKRPGTESETLHREWLEDHRTYLACPTCSSEGTAIQGLDIVQCPMCNGTGFAEIIEVKDEPDLPNA